VHPFRFAGAKVIIFIELTKLFRYFFQANAYFPSFSWLFERLTLPNGLRWRDYATFAEQ
jgi:hypothetical protein